MTHFPLVTQLFSVKKCVTQGMSTVQKSTKTFFRLRIFRSQRIPQVIAELDYLIGYLVEVILSIKLFLSKKTKAGKL